VMLPTALPCMEFFGCSLINTDVIKDPPCSLSSYVYFPGGVCPYSGETICGKCISNEFEKQCVNILANTKEFGLA